MSEWKRLHYYRWTFPIAGRERNWCSFTPAHPSRCTEIRIRDGVFHQIQANRVTLVTGRITIGSSYRFQEVRGLPLMPDGELRAYFEPDPGKGLVEIDLYLFAHRRPWHAAIEIA